MATFVTNLMASSPYPWLGGLLGLLALVLVRATRRPTPLPPQRRTPAGPPPLRVAVAQLDGQGRSPSQIARALGLPQDVVRTLLRDQDRRRGKPCRAIGSASSPTIRKSRVFGAWSAETPGTGLATPEILRSTPEEPCH